MKVSLGEIDPGARGTGEVRLLGFLRARAHAHRSLPPATNEDTARARLHLPCAQTDRRPCGSFFLVLARATSHVVEMCPVTLHTQSGHCGRFPWVS